MQVCGRFSSIALRTAQRAECHSGSASLVAPINASSLARGIGILAIFFALGIVPAASGIESATAAEADCTSEDSSAPCQTEEDRAENAKEIDMFVRARNGYNQARTSGDFTEPLTLTRQLAAQGNGAGKGLLRMVYMQLGSGAHKDYVQAYAWLSEGIARSADYPVKGGAVFVSKWRRRLEEKMTSEQIADAKKLAGN